ncbi:MAG: galactokinase [Cyclobacteriaceae bacterium]
MDVVSADIERCFTQFFNRKPFMVRAPGRINLIGEHTDYNDGFVMPAAIDKELFFGISPSDDHRTILYSMKYDERFEVDLQNPKPVKEPRWANYILGVLFQFINNGYSVKPFYCAFGGDVPLGAGMSSSAAMECGFAFALNEVNGLAVPKLKMIKMAQWAEHNFVGVQCGIMDQFASVMGKEGHVILLDCRSLTHHYFPLNLQEYGIILCDTKVKHSLVDTEYNTRRQECSSGVNILTRYYPEVKSLRDVSLTMLEKHKSELPGKVFNRCLYVVQEIQRVQQAGRDLEKGDLRAFGKKMYETHEGLSRLYEVSCQELDFLVKEAGQLNEVLGARMMGGGFGGCTINLVKNDFMEAFIRHQTTAYKKAFSIDMLTYRVKVVDGVGRV